MVSIKKHREERNAKPHPYLSQSWWNRQNELTPTLDCVTFRMRDSKVILVVNQKKTRSKNNIIWGQNLEYSNNATSGKSRLIRRVRIQILGLTEVRWKHAGDFTSQGISVIYSAGMSIRHESRGCLKDFSITDVYRIMVARIRTESE